MQLAAKLDTKPQTRHAGEGARQGELFGTKPRRPYLWRMHVIDAGQVHSGAEEDLGKPLCRMACARCGAETTWLIFETVTEAKRGVPCETCNKGRAAP